MLIVGAAGAQSPDELLVRADHLKTANNSEFQTLLEQLDGRADALSPAQRDFVEYLHAWQLGYVGRYEDALASFRRLLARVDDRTLQARARVSLINVEINAAQYEEAYATLDALLESASRIEDRTARLLSYTIAATLYGDAGQSDLSLHYVEQALAFDQGDRATCVALTTKAATLAKTGVLRGDDPDLQAGLAACTRIDDVLYVDLLHAYQAQALLSAGHGDQALHVLQAHDAEMLGTHSAAATALFRALLARCELLAGDLEGARAAALSVIDPGIAQSRSKSVADAYAVLYEVAKTQNHPREALGYHERYAAAERAYTSDAGARSLAYEMVKEQVFDKKREIAALSERNDVLQLEQGVAGKVAETQRLYVALLLFGLASALVWAWRTKRSQLRFRQLSRQDGLTGIVNRQHFMQDARLQLQNCAKESRQAALVLIDLDNFKSINDTCGHAAGDTVLKQAAAARGARMRTFELFGRVGGEEFAVLLTDCGLEDARSRAEELRTTIATIPRPDPELVMSASFGVTSTLESGHSLRRMLIHADRALYRAKHGGRNRVEAFAANGDFAEGCAEPPIRRAGDEEYAGH